MRMLSNRFDKANTRNRTDLIHPENIRNLKFFPLLFMMSLFFACGPEREINEEWTYRLKLSVPLAEEEDLTTGEVDFEFEILEGNGGYEATVSDELSAKVTIEGEKVMVHLLSTSSVKVTIIDQKGESASISIQSTNESLYPAPVSLGLDKGDTYALDINFGAGGPYTIERVRGNASTASIEGDKVKVTSLEYGNTYYHIKDKRGTIMQFYVRTSLGFDMDKESKFLEFDGLNNLTVTISLLWGGTEWEIVSVTENIIEDVFVSQLYLPGGGMTDYYVIFIYTVDEGKGSDTITLKNKEGDEFVVKVHIK